jgi:hypothetical protein
MEGMRNGVPSQAPNVGSNIPCSGSRNTLIARGKFPVLHVGIWRDGAEFLMKS